MCYLFMFHVPSSVHSYEDIVVGWLGWLSKEVETWNGT